MSQWSDWLRELHASGKGGLGLPGRPQVRAIDRGLPYEYKLAIGANVAADTFKASIRPSPDAVGSAVEFAVTVGAYADGFTPVSLYLNASQTASLALDADLDGVEEMVFDILWTPSGGLQQRLMGGTIKISGKVTDAS